MQGRRSPRYITAAVAAISLHCLQAEAAAFSTSRTFSQRRERYSSLTSARPQSLLEGAVARDIIGSASSTLDESRGGRGPLHQPCQQPLTMSMDELLTIGKTESRFMPMRRGAVGRQFSSPRHLVPGRGGSSTTSLSISRSTGSNVLGFQVEENDNIDWDAGELQFSFEDFANYNNDRPLRPRIISPTISLQNSDAKLGGEDVRPDSLVENVPPCVLPWVPSETQINALKKNELRAACAERDLIMSGKKADLQQRLLAWATVQDRKRVKDRLSGLKYLIELSKKSKGEIIVVDMPDVDTDNYDVEALTNKRKALTKEKKGKRKRGVLGLVDESFFSNSTDVTKIDDDIDKEDVEDEYDDETNDSMVNEESINQLSKTFSSPSSIYSNREVREMYMAAKLADQAGDRKRSKAILTQLREATPNDMRVVRRLARMESEDGNLHSARAMLVQALRSEPENSHLLNGLAQLERLAGNDNSAKKYYRRAIKCNPTYPNPYHALGTLEHTHGNIGAALNVIKEGIKNCPYNHRLHHALGDVYMDANMLDLAEGSYLVGLQHGPEWSKAFFYTSLSFVSYAQGHKRDSRTLLRQSLDVTGGMHAQGVIALAQLEESEGNIEQARKVYRDALTSYEDKRRSRTYRQTSPDQGSESVERGNQYARSYSGDKWINVVKSWARMETIHGTYESTHIVLGKAAKLFPNDVSLLIQWADLQASHGEAKKARLLYEAACHRAGSRSADPYQSFAEYEMKKKNYVESQAILIQGAQALSDVDNLDACVDVGKSGLARLFHTWGVCEYHLGNPSRAEQLFDNALRLTGSKEGDATMRSLILYSMARLEYSRGEYLLAQHCIALSLHENLLPGGNSLTWKLWYQIAEKMHNHHLATRCKEQALLRYEEERGGAISGLSRLLGSSNGRLSERTGSAMKEMFRKTPWHGKVSPTGVIDKNWYSGARLWHCK